MTTIKSARLTIAPPFVHEGMNVSHYLRWLNNAMVMQYSEQRHVNHTEASQYEYICSFANSPHYLWDIRRNDTPIGTVTAYRDIHNKTANVGVLIGEAKHWCKGYASETWDAVCTFLFEEGTRKIEAGCMASNTAMQRVLEKTGFTHEATISQHFLVRGKPEDKLCYGKLRAAKVIPIKKEASASAD